jgi:acyl-CoA thioester hydrolase
VTERYSRWHAHPLRVRYQETDQMAVVFHTNYLNWFEIGRTELIRSLGIEYKAIEREGLLLPVIDLDCAFEAPARYDDTVLVFTRVASCSKIRISFQNEVRRVEAPEWKSGTWEPGDELPGERLVYGGTRHAWVTKEMQPARLDKRMPALYDLFINLLKQDA